LVIFRGKGQTAGIVRIGGGEGKRYFLGRGKEERDFFLSTIKRGKGTLLNRLAKGEKALHQLSAGGRGKSSVAAGAIKDTLD